MKVLINLVFIITLSSNSLAALTCSQNGTKIIYINDPSISEIQAVANKDMVKKFLNTSYYSKVDEKSKVEIDQVINYDLGFTNNSYNTAIKVQKEKGVKNPELIWTILNNGVDALSIANEVPGYMKAFSFLKNGLKVFEFSQLINAKTSWSQALARVLSSTIGDQLNENTKNDLNAKIIGSLADNTKVIVVSHGQGGLYSTDVLNSLVNNDNLFREKAQKYVGEVRTGSYSAIRALASNKTESIKLDKDLMGNLFGEPSNYVSVPSNLTNNNIFAEIYLSNTLKAFDHVDGVITDQPILMSNIFINKVSEVAKGLDSNCTCPNVEGFYPEVQDTFGVMKFRANTDSNGGFVYASNMEYTVLGLAEVDQGSIKAGDWVPLEASTEDPNAFIFSKNGNSIVPFASFDVGKWKYSQFKLASKNNLSSCPSRSTGGLINNVVDQYYCAGAYGASVNVSLGDKTFQLQSTLAPEYCQNCYKCGCKKIREIVAKPDNLNASMSFANLSIQSYVGASPLMPNNLLLFIFSGSQVLSGSIQYQVRVDDSFSNLNGGCFFKDIDTGEVLFQ